MPPMHAQHSARGFFALRIPSCPLWTLAFLWLAGGARGQEFKALRTVFQTRCVVCHNEKALANPAVSGGLALDTFAALKKGVSGRAVIVTGKAEESELYRRLVAASPTKLMPKGGPALPKEQIALVKRWIEAGTKPDTTGAEKPTAEARLESVPMPALPALNDVPLTTRIKPPSDLLPKGASASPTLALTLKIGPLSPFTSLAFSPDGKTLAVGGYRAVTLFDVATGRPIASLTQLPGPALALAFRPDGSLLAVAGGAASAGGEVRLFDVKTFSPVGKPLTGHADVVYGVAWSPDGTRLATASHDKTARLWEWPSGKELFVYKDHSDAVTRVAFAPDGKSLYTASMDRNVRRFSTEDGSTLRSFTGHAEGVIALAVNADGSRVLSSGAEPRIRWWNTGDGNTVYYGDAHGAPVNDIAFSKDGKRVVTASADKTVRVWDGVSGGHQRALEGAGDWLHAVAISPDSRLTAGAGADGTVRLWETETGRLRLTLLFWPPMQKGGSVEWLALTPEGYFDASPNWSRLLRPQIAGKDVAKSALVQFLPKLASPDAVQKSLKGENIEPAQFAPPPSAPVGKPGVK